MFFLESSLLAPCSHCPPSSSTSHSPEARNGESAFDTSLMFVLKRRPLPFRLCLFCSLPHFHSFIAHLRMAGAGVLRARILALTSTVSVRRDVSFCFARCEPATNGRRVGKAFRFRSRGAGLGLVVGFNWRGRNLALPGHYRAAGIGGSPKLGNPNENFRRHCSGQMGRNPLWPRSSDSGSSALKPQTASCIPTFRAQTFRRTTDGGGGGRQRRREAGREGGQATEGGRRKSTVASESHRRREGGSI